MCGDEFPLHQGQLDFLCGIYAAINAMHLRGEFCTVDQCAIPFRLAFMYMQSQVEWSPVDAICFGVDEDDYCELLRVMSGRDWKHIPDPSYHDLKKYKQDLKDKKATIIASLVEPDANSYHLNPKRYVIHYTVLTDVTAAAFEIYDSQGLPSIERGKKFLSYGEEEVELGSLYVMSYE